ncbi:MAG: TRAP transporter substrate-binding protein DctP [Gammaproteobacteria bacterium]
MLAAALAAFVMSSALFAVGSPPAQAFTKYCDGPKVTWRTSFWGKRRAITEGMEYVAKAAREATCGNFDIQIFYGEQLSKSKENLDSIKVGAIQGAQMCASYHPGKVRPLTVLDLPFLPIPNLDVMQAVYTRMFETPEFKKALADWNAEYYMAMMLPQFEVMGRGKPPLTLDDWKGRRVRSLGGTGKAMSALGAVPTSMPASEVYSALQRGTIEAVAFAYTYAFAAFKVDEISSWYTTNMSLASLNCAFVANKDAVAKLPAQYKELLAEARGPGYEALKASYAAKDKINLPKWQKGGKLQAITYKRGELEELRKAGGAPVWEEWVKQNEAEGVPARKLLDLVLKTAEENAGK